MQLLRGSSSLMAMLGRYEIGICCSNFCKFVSGLLTLVRKLHVLSRRPSWTCQNICSSVKEFRSVENCTRRSLDGDLSQTWERDTASFKSLADLHAWLHATHLCYSVSRQVPQAFKTKTKLPVTLSTCGTHVSGILKVNLPKEGFVLVRLHHCCFMQGLFLLLS